MAFNITKIDHVQVAAPKGCEEQARNFYSGILGMKELEKPEPLQARGGAWFEFPGFQLHVGVEEPFEPAKKAHPAFVVEGFDELKAHLLEKGVAVKDDTSIPGSIRFFAADPFGNRLEFLKQAMASQ
ncbi:VOC family protein [Planococcus sp. APC 3906]|uniref:VOC family protein n=1 Tax=Planococcus sp. APC 3906 TaxID=3035194 RepID=UPI0025B41C8C|nr:VOC family protein [Planococcus sp. APC 3906]MDN3448731.1 VOC family protein [Planococcus sp. APC 3906]